ncbi:MAG TPA: hypothetical protein VKB76_17385, partial [Ktedonobacterales bacterium]|nr:hypothetical protein [Ktedonobacterales bacterium]
REPPEVPDDVEQRYKELQEEIQQLELSPKLITGETHQERYLRQRRLRALHRDFDRMARYPMSRRIRRNSASLGALFIVAFLLCIISFFGGALLTGIIGNAQKMTSVGDQFMTDLTHQQYNTAHAFVDQYFNATGQFAQQAQQADQALGPIQSFSQVGVVGGTPSSQTNTITYHIHRKGGTGQNANGTQTVYPPKDYIVVVTFDYNPTTNNWQISNYNDQLFAIPTQQPTTSGS